ncbi:MAG: hypothetical protein MUD00_00265 [Candidatus Pacebacteria bacterium]|jgi:hypothetical protein|nr:hypothetical protein [Candidatus Paceibacterota bacterium]
MESLGKLFGSEARVKIMRLFLLNSEAVFDATDIMSRSKVSKKQLPREMRILEAAGFVKTKTFFKEFEKKSGKKLVKSKKRVAGWQLVFSYSHLKALRQLLIENSSFEHKDLLSRFRSAGKLKLCIVAGVFIKNPDSRVDLMIVGDGLKRSSIEAVLRSLESEIGRELVYALFTTNDFLYRLDMQDKLIRDILDYPHEKILDMTGIPLGR